MSYLSIIEGEELIKYLNNITEHIEKYSDVPVKPMTEYEVADIVKLRSGYEMISQELQELRSVLDL